MPLDTALLTEPIETVEPSDIGGRRALPRSSAPLKVAVALLDISQEFQRLQARDAHSIGAHLGCEIELLFAGGSARVQERQLRELLQRPVPHRPALIVAQPVGNDRLSGVAEEAAARGIGWVLINPRSPYLDALRERHPALPIAAVSADQAEIGRIQGRQVLATLGGGPGRVLYVTGPSYTSAAQDRLSATRAALASSALTLDVVEGDWTESRAFEAVSAWIRSRRAIWRRWTGGGAQPPAAIVCQNDHMALGARRAFREHGQAESSLPPTFGVDGLREGGQSLVDLGELHATVVVPPNTGPAIHLAVTTLRHGAPLPAQVLMSPRSYPAVEDLARRRPATCVRRS